MKPKHKALLDLTEWECDFLDSLELQRDRACEAGELWKLTPKQMDKLHEIARRIGLED
jgi:hypothetical protein